MVKEFILYLAKQWIPKWQTVQQLFKKIMQAALAIRGLSNGGFDYSWTEKVA